MVRGRVSQKYFVLNKTVGTNTTQCCACHMTIEINRITCRHIFQCSPWWKWHIAGRWVNIRLSAACCDWIITGQRLLLKDGNKTADPPTPLHSARRTGSEARIAQVSNRNAFVLDCKHREILLVRCVFGANRNAIKYFNQIALSISLFSCSRNVGN